MPGIATPYQLKLTTPPFSSLLLKAIVDPACDMATVASDHGLDPDVDSPEPECLSELVVPDTSLPLSSASVQYLKSTVDPLTSSGDGTDLYIQVVLCVLS